MISFDYSKASQFISAEEIENMENSLIEMKQAKKDLEEQIKMARLVELDELISSKGLTFEEVKEMLTK